MRIPLPDGDEMDWNPEIMTSEEFMQQVWEGVVQAVEQVHASVVRAEAEWKQMREAG